MKANITRGNSITDNYKPHPVDVLFNVGMELFKNFACIPRPMPKYAKGTPIEGQEYLKRPNGEIQLLPRNHRLKKEKDFRGMPLYCRINNIWQVIDSTRVL
jgi:hypothetical protein